MNRGRYAPVFDIDVRHDELIWECWIEGFESAVALRPASWRAILEVESGAQIALAGLVSLAEIGRDETRLPKDVADDLTGNAPELSAQWVDVLNRWRLRQDLARLPGRPEPRFGKVGRNEPCPCVSGKKYKRCCGAH